ncbi:hypothetical protein JCM6294_464 [Bacteroides pyogenes DSM 20611 = JCM 6294]|uniref:Uncharacterized protein n=1 Tax=Bacteroides pyogenes DSM 20611 = JCM 6294 TaxID=1121100 RepID=W4PET6_9BACE|nr:hypothetical protein JCM6294_464 [Bacteroides pyogenes DSM 20611 = JCM 6294]
MRTIAIRALRTVGRFFIVESRTIRAVATFTIEGGTLRTIAIRALRTVVVSFAVCIKPRTIRAVSTLTIERGTLRAIAIRALRTIVAIFSVCIKSRTIRAVTAFAIIRRAVVASFSVVKSVTVTAGAFILLIKRVVAPFFISCVHCFFIRIKLNFGLTAGILNVICNITLPYMCAE